MPDKKISEFPDGAPALVADTFPIERGGLVNFRLTLQNLLDLISGYLFPTLDTNTLSAVTTNVGTFTTVSNATIDGVLDVTNTATYTKDVANSGNVNTLGSMTNNGTTLLKGSTTISGDTTYTNPAGHSGVNTFSNNITVNDTGSLLIKGKFEATSDVTLAAGSTITINPTVGDNTNKIATTAYVKNSMFATIQSYYGWVPGVTYSYGARALDTVYYNTTGRAIYVAVQFFQLPAGGGGVSLFASSSGTSSLSLLSIMGGPAWKYYTTSRAMVYGIIPSGKSYMVSAYSGLNYSVWRELR